VKRLKEAACCSAGIFCGATALQTYVQVFDEEQALPRFEAFASLNGARFYGLKPNAGTVVLKRLPGRVMASVAVESDDEVVVFRGGEDLAWSIAEVRP
jgi:dihydroorotase